MRWIVTALLLFLTQCATQPQIESAKKTPKNSPEPQFDRRKISRTISSHKSYIQQCYGKALMGQNSSKLKGTLFVAFSIGPDGKGSSPRVIPEKSSIQNDSLSRCLFAGIKSWDFPVHPDGVDLNVRYPFKFSDKPPAKMQKTLDQFEKLRR